MLQFTDMEYSWIEIMRANILRKVIVISDKYAIRSLIVANFDYLSIMTEKNNLA